MTGRAPVAAAAGIVLAAGAGTRFGGPKALARLEGEPLVTRSLRILRDAGCAPLVVVLGARAARVRDEADLSGAEVVVNPGWATGIASSLVAGLVALSGRAPAAVVALADQPLVTPEVVRRLVSAWGDGALAAVATYDGAPRNPVLLDAAVWDDVAAGVHGDEGARAWLRAHPEHVTFVECGAVGSAADVDTPQDLRSLARTTGRAMELTHTFTVPRPAAETFAILRDIERIAPCMPGASIDSVDGDVFSGKVKVKVGPMQVTYTGTARFAEVDEENFRGVIEASGKEVRGAGTAKATFTATLTPKGDETEVVVVSDLAITGRPAQFGRGVMADVGEKLIGQFADCLASEFARVEEPAVEEPAVEEPAAGEPVTAASTAATAARAAAPAEAQPAAERARPTDEVLDLLDVAGGSVLKRVAPVLAAVALLALIVWLIRR